MKNIVLILILLCQCGILQSQEFAPIGAVWHYTYLIPEGGPCWGYVEVESIKDTVVQSKACRLLRSNIDVSLCTQSVISGREYIMHSDSGKVYVYFEGGFHLVNDFTMAQGDSILVSVKDLYGLSLFDEPFYAKVDSMDTIEINGIMLKKWYLSAFVDFEDYYEEQLEYIGNLNWLFYAYWGPATDYDAPHGIRCYTDPNIGHHQFNTYLQLDSCTEVIYPVATEEPGRLDDGLEVYPNPTSDFLNVWFYNPQLRGEAHFELLDATGKSVLAFHSRQGEITHTIPVSDLARGTYWLTCRVGDTVLTEAVVVE